MTIQFQKAVRKKAKLRLGLSGPSGSGKTWGALKIAKGMGGRIAVIDTEKGSASLYAGMKGMPEFDVLELGSPYTPERYIEAIRAAEDAGYEIIIIDSTTHEWSGVGGCLELVDELTRSKYRGNNWAAWNDVTPRHREFIDAILQSSSHIICTMRSKTETAQTEENGKKKVVKLGMKDEQRDGFEYELTLKFEIVHDGHYAVATKNRTSLFKGDPEVISEKTGKALIEWLNSGTEPEPVKSALAQMSERVDAYIKQIQATTDKAQLDTVWGEGEQLRADVKEIAKSNPGAVDLWNAIRDAAKKHAEKFTAAQEQEQE